MAVDLEALAARLQRIEDELAIRRVVLSYGPAVDSGLSAQTGSMFADDGEYNWDKAGPSLAGPAAITAMLESDMHQSLMVEGVAHVAGPPLIEVDGDRANALFYSFVLRRDAEQQRFYVWRLAAAQLELTRVDGAWRIQRRTHRALDESGAGKDFFGDLLRAGFSADAFGDVSSH